MFKRFFDIFVGLSLLVVLLPLMILVAIAVKSTSDGPVLYVSDRVGLKRRIIRMPKFRTMHIDTPEVATDLLTDPTVVTTPIGKYLRKYSLDELPQLFSVVRGQMSLVGPRPALYNQADLIEMRDVLGIYEVKPGITGWAQVQGRDTISMSRKVALDKQYLEEMSFVFDCKILVMTVFSSIRANTVSH